MVSPCLLCNAKCCKEFLITITIFDALRIEKSTGKQIQEFCVIEKPKMLNSNQQEWIRYFDKGLEDYGVLAIKSKPCIFLNNNRCSIWKYAPVSCKLYPITIENKIVQGAICPLLSKFGFMIVKQKKEIIKTAEKEAALYRTIVKKTYKTKIEKSNVFSFLKQEAKKLNNYSIDSY